MDNVLAHVAGVFTTEGSVNEISPAWRQIPEPSFDDAFAWLSVDIWRADQTEFLEEFNVRIEVVSKPSVSLCDMVVASDALAGFGIFEEEHSVDFEVSEPGDELDVGLCEREFFEVFLPKVIYRGFFADGAAPALNATFRFWALLEECLVA